MQTILNILLVACIVIIAVSGIRLYFSKKEVNRLKKERDELERKKDK